MHYLSVFFTIVISWLAIISIAAVGHNNVDVFSIYLMSITFTLVMYFVGFWHK